MRKVFWLAFLFLLGCGGPKYVVRYRYLPPVDPGARKCLKECERKFQACEKRCQKEQEDCRRRARQEAVKLYQEMLKTYRQELRAYRERSRLYHRELTLWNDEYRRLYEDYLFFKKACQEEEDERACRRRRELERHLEALEHEKPLKPREPREPRLEDISRKLAASCKKDCGCQKAYDNCFLSCGGKLIPEKFCVENCPEGSK